MLSPYYYYQTIKLFQRKVISSPCQPFSTFNKFDPYKTLNVPKNASPQDIKKAYYALVKSHHPDKTNDPKDKARFLDIAKAYQVLKNPEQKRMYDSGYTSTYNPYNSRRNDNSNTSQNKDEIDPEMQRYQDILKTHKGPIYMSNWKLALLVIGFGCIGGTISILSFKRSREWLVERLRNSDMRTKEYYERKKEEALQTTFEEKIQALRDREARESRSAKEVLNTTGS